MPNGTYGHFYTIGAPQSTCEGPRSKLLGIPEFWGIRQPMWSRNGRFLTKNEIGQLSIFRVQYVREEAEMGKITLGCFEAP